MSLPCRVGLVVSVSASRTVSREIASRPGNNKDHHNNGTNCLPAWHAMRLGRSLTVQPDCIKGRVVCGTVYGDMTLKRSPEINRKSRVSYPGPRLLSSATWSSLPLNHTINGVRANIFRHLFYAYIKGIYEFLLAFSNGTNCLPAWHAMRLGRSLTVQPDCLKGRVVGGTVYGDMTLKRSPEINRKSMVSYPGPGLLSSATWSSLPLNHTINGVRANIFRHLFYAYIKGIYEFLLA